MFMLSRPVAGRTGDEHDLLVSAQSGQGNNGHGEAQNSLIHALGLIWLALSIFRPGKTWVNLKPSAKTSAL
jgi:hypothetical protein